ncbi:MAG: hypothetical protein E6Q83_05005 [Thiothrix sp.]|nr:MAG: hypothetical protein E6Q83_05005 [Thiothrix sp.]
MTKQTRQPATRAELEALETELVKREQKLVADLQGAHDKDLEEQAIERESDDVWDALLIQTRSELAEVRAILLRMK